MADVFANIGLAGARMRLVIGAVLLVASLAATVLLLQNDVDRNARLLLFFLYLGTLAAFLEVRQKTCVLHALRGTQETPGGTAPIADSSLAGRLRRRGLVLLLISASVAAVLTVVVWLLP